jgi:hypothetical protein
MSETLMKIGAIASFGIAAYLLAMIARQSNRRARAAAMASDAELKSGRIITSGWSAAEARKILADFAGLYDLDAATFVVTDGGGALQVTWKRPITTSITLYLVNYLSYPGADGLSGKQAEAVGVIPAPAGVDPDGVAAGALAKIFVPEGDTEHDLVHALTAGGRAFRISFTRMAWQPITAARAPALAGQVAFTLEG